MPLQLRSLLLDVRCADKYRITTVVVVVSFLLLFVGVTSLTTHEPSSETRMNSTTLSRDAHLPYHPMQGEKGVSAALVVDED